MRTRKPRLRGYVAYPRITWLKSGKVGIQTGWWVRLKLTWGSVVLKLQVLAH